MIDYVIYVYGKVSFQSNLNKNIMDCGANGVAPDHFTRNRWGRWGRIVKGVDGEIVMADLYRAGQLSIGIGYMEGWRDDDEDWEDKEEEELEEKPDPSSLHRPLRYAPPWPELSPRAVYWYGWLDRVISGGLWVAKATGRIEDYYVSDVRLCFQAWPDSMDGKHFGQYPSEWRGSTTRFYKVGRLVVVVIPKGWTLPQKEIEEEEGRKPEEESSQLQ